MFCVTQCLNDLGECACVIPANQAVNAEVCVVICIYLGVVCLIM